MPPKITAHSKVVPNWAPDAEAATISPAPRPVAATMIPGPVNFKRLKRDKGDPCLKINNY